MTDDPLPSRAFASLALLRASCRAVAGLVALVSLLLLSGCATVPSQHSAIDSVDVYGTSKLSSSDVSDTMATAESPKFLGLFRGFVYDYELFDRYVFQKDLERVERFYRARGYYEAHARAGRVFATSKDHVRVEVAVEEGPPVLLKRADIKLSVDMDPKILKKAREAMLEQLPLNQPLDEDKFAAAETAVRRVFTDNAYAFTQTLRHANVDLPKHSAEVTIEVYPGEKSIFGDVTIEGYGNLPLTQIKLALGIEKGKPYSTQVIEDGRQSVLDLGAFSTADVTPTLGDMPTYEVPIHVKLEVSKLHALSFGGGVELDVLRTDLHLLAGYEDRNFFGGFRHFTASFKPGVELYPTTISDLQSPTNLLPEGKLRLQLVQPGLIDRKTNGVIRVEGNYFPVIFPGHNATEATTGSNSGAQGSTSTGKPPILGYEEGKGAIGVERTFWKFFVSPTYNIQVDQPFAYHGIPIASNSSTSGLTAPVSLITLSYIEIDTHLDLRNDSIHPRKGIYLDNDFHVAGLGGSAVDIREQPEARFYIPFGKRVVLALRGTVGFLFPQNYGNAINDTSGTASQADKDRDAQILLFRGFYSGGSNDNRGYPLRAIGPHYAVPFLNPNVAARSNSIGCPVNPTQAELNAPAGSPMAISQDCKVPIGGRSIWEANAELRYNLGGALSLAAFCDTSNVQANLALNFAYPHLSCGPGVRYDTPVGPVRLDLAYRVTGIDPATEAKVDGLFGIDAVPVAIAFGIGESF